MCSEKRFVIVILLALKSIIALQRTVTSYAGINHGEKKKKNNILCIDL
jgi:hypothetical protein